MKNYWYTFHILMLSCLIFITVTDRVKVNFLLWTRKQNPEISSHLLGIFGCLWKRDVRGNLVQSCLLHLEISLSQGNRLKSTLDEANNLVHDIFVSFLCLWKLLEPSGSFYVLRRNYRQTTEGCFSGLILYLHKHLLSNCYALCVVLSTRNKTTEY